MLSVHSFIPIKVSLIRSLINIVKQQAHALKSFTKYVPFSTYLTFVIMNANNKDPRSRKIYAEHSIYSCILFEYQHI